MKKKTKNKMVSLFITSFIIVGCGGGSSSDSSDSDHTTTTVQNDPTTSNDSNNGGTNSTTSETSSCGSELFSVSPILITDLNSQTGIIPLGNLAAPAHTFPTPHMYFQIRDAGNDGAPVDNVPFYAPGNFTITQITSSENLTLGRADYIIRFTPCDEVTGYFDHVATLNSTLQTAFDGTEGTCNTYSVGGEEYQQCDKNITRSVTAGEQLGTAGGETSGSAALDFGLRDSRAISLIYANPDRNYASPDGNDLFHVVCPIDYYTTDMKTQLLEKIYRLGNVDPVCGEVAQDIAGTAQGLWYLEGTPSPTLREDDHLALVKGNIDPSQEVISVGNSSVGSGNYYFTPQSSGMLNRNFSEISADTNTYCYENLTSHLGGSFSNTIFLLQMTSTAILKIEKQSSQECGTGPWVLTSSAVTFER